MTSRPPGGPLPPSDIGRLTDLHSHVAAALVLLAKGGRVAQSCPSASAASRRAGGRLLKHLSRLLAALKEGPAVYAGPLAGDGGRQDGHGV